jgi:branched-chain amino acid transport system ATP-binding protein
VSQSDGALLRVENLTKHFGGLTAVNDITMSFQPHKLHSIIGPNGAGKTTYFNLLTGMFLPSAGKIFLKNRDITSLGPDDTFRLRLVRTFQITSIFPMLSLLKNVEIAAQGRYRGSNSPLSRLTRKRGDIRRLCLERLEQFGLVNQADRRAGLLAYGDKRRLEIVMGLVSDPEILLLDEPTAGMSPEETTETARIIRDISRQVTVLLVEHDMRVVMGVSDRITVLHQGSVLADGPPEAIMADPKVQAVYLGQASCEPVFWPEL